MDGDPVSESTPVPAPSAELLARGLALEYATLAWNVAGTGVLVWQAMQARSVALAGFGLDSLIEILASVIVVWELSDQRHTRRRRALRLMGAAFIALALYVLVQSGRALLSASRPGGSPLGILWLAVTVGVMLGLAWGKSSVGRKLGNPVLLTESRVTLVDACLAASVLIGVGLDALRGWWWADPVAGLVIVVYGCMEGTHAWREGGSA